MSGIAAAKKSLISIIGLLLISLTIVSPAALAERATNAEMNDICQNWLLLNSSQNSGWREAANPEISSTEDIVESGLMVGRIYHISPNGFVVVPVMKEMPPVMAFSDKYNLDDNQIEGMRALVAEVLYDRARVYIEAYGSLDAVQPDNGEVLLGRRHRDLWNKYTKSQEEFIGDIKSGLFSERYEQAGPLLTTTWHQGYPYNMYCPTGYGGHRCVVGCTATAAAQILYYWQWPAAGRGFSSYFWGGDNACDTTTPGMSLSADFSDPYIYDGSPESVAELSYEVGVAYRMDYSVCGSGAYMEPGMTVLPQYFKYKPQILKRTRSSVSSADDWYSIIKNEIDAGRPIHYGIHLHSIVCDGYRESGGIKYYHMNYGWGGSMNSWFAIDDLYCPWDGCSFTLEFQIYNIEPSWVWPTSDATFGAVPFEINLTAETEFNVENWSWDFGDGSTISGNYPSAQHTYSSPGIYDLKVDIESGGEVFSATRPDYIVVVADTISVGRAEGELSGPVEVPIYGTNTVPLNNIVIPVKYSGAMQLRYDSCSVAGCRTDGFMLDGNSLGSGFLKFELTGSSSNLESGSGLLLKIYFTILSGTDEQTATISLNNIGSIYPLFKNNNSGIQYNPATQSGTVTFPGTYGDANSDHAINILDVVFIINYIYKSGPSPQPEYTANVNGDADINILDIVYLINFIYKQGPPPIAE